MGYKTRTPGVRIFLGYKRPKWGTVPPNGVRLATLSVTIRLLAEINQKRNIVKLTYMQLFRYDLFEKQDCFIAMRKFELRVRISNLERFHTSTVC